MAAHLTSLFGELPPALAEYINSQLKGGSNYAKALVPTQGESIVIYKFHFDELFSAGRSSTFQPPSYQESCSNAKSTQPDIQSQASYTPTSTGIEDMAFEGSEIDGDNVEIENFNNNNNGRTGGAWVAPVKSTAFRGAKIRGNVKIASQSNNGNSYVRQ